MNDATRVMFNTAPCRRGQGRRLAARLGLWMCLATATAWAQPVDLNSLLGGKTSRGIPKAEFTATLAPATVRPGDEVTVSIRARLPEGYYIYGTETTFDARTRIDIQTEGLQPLDDGFTPDRPVKAVFDPDLRQEVTKHYGSVTWTRKFRVTDEAQGSVVRVSGTLNGQYCSGPEAGGQCIPVRPPFQFALTAQLQSVPSPRPPTAVHAEAARFRQVIRPVRPRQGASTPDPIEFTFQLAPATARRGDRVTLSVTAKLDAGWHTYSLTQTGAGAVPTEIELDQLRHLRPIGEGFQADRPFQARPADDAVLEEYHDQVTWSREFEVLSEQPGDYGATGTVTYAVCDARSCLPVKVVEFAVGQLTESPPAAAPDPGWPVADDAAEAPSPFAPAADGLLARGNLTDPPGALPAAAAGTATDGALRLLAKKPQDEGLLAFLVLCLGGGFFALLTPCSFPMVPITVSFFLKQSELQHKRPWLLALVYCGTIVMTFTVLGVGIAALFGVLKLNELANIAWLNAVIGGVFVLFALNMLGVFEIHVPSSVLTWSARHEGGGSYVGAIFMGLTFTLTSFTCTFAIAGGLLAGAAQGEFYWSILGMAAFGTAFAAPFFVLALVPRLIARLPKSGGWMNTVKVVLGLLELGAAVKFFSIADPKQYLFDHVVVMLLWTVLSLVTALYLLGFFRLTHDGPAGPISVFRALLGTGFAFLAGLLAIGLVMPHAGGGVLLNQILAFAPPRFEAGEGPLGPMIEHHGVEFGLDIERAIPVAEAQRQPLLLDFTGVNCANCRYMERLMGQPGWKQRIEKFVPIQLYVDVDAVPGIADTNYARRIRQRNLELFEQFFPAGGMPSYAVTTPDGRQVLATYEGAERADRAGSFTKFLDEGLLAWEQLKPRWRAAPQAKRGSEPPQS